MSDKLNRVCHHGDNLRWLQSLEPGSVDMVVADPPYFSQRDWGAFSDEWDGVNESEWTALHAGARAIVEAARVAHSEPLAAYLTFMGVRLEAARVAMAKHASIYVFCDDAANGWLRTLMDAVFGKNRFCNELVWKRSRANNLPGSKWKRDADRILFYRGAKATWNQPWIPLDPEYVKQHYKPLSEITGGKANGMGRTVDKGLMPKAMDAEGVEERLATWDGAHRADASEGYKGDKTERLAQSVATSKPAAWSYSEPSPEDGERLARTEQTVFPRLSHGHQQAERPDRRHKEPFLGVSPPPGRHWRWTRETMERLHAEGRLIVSPTGKSLRYIHFLDESKGQRHGSLFLDDPPPSSAEFTGYPTQKPLSLLRRLIEASSNPDDLVIDPFCGSGTTLVAAEQAGRRWAGCDDSPLARQVAVPRLEAECHGLFGGDVTVETDE